MIELYQKKNGGSYYARKQVNGKRLSWCTGSTNKKEARTLAAEWIRNLVAGHNEPLMKTARRRQYASVGDAIAAYLASSRLKCNPDTALKNVRNLRNLIAQGGGLDDQSGLDQLTPELVRKFYDVRLAGKAGTQRLTAATTANSIYRMARSVLGRNVIKKGVYNDLRIPKDSLESFREVEMQDEGETVYELPDPKILKAIMDDTTRIRKVDPGVFCAFLISISTGLRKGEASRLEWADLVQENGVWIALVKNKAKLTKSKRGRRVPMLPAVINELRRFRTEADEDGNREDDHVIPARSRWDRNEGCWIRLAEWFKSHGWNREKKAHEMRKFFGAQVATQQGLYAAQSYLGHSDPKITAKYYATMVDIRPPAITLPSSVEEKSANATIDQPKRIEG